MAKRGNSENTGNACFRRIFGIFQFRSKESGGLHRCSHFDYIIEEANYLIAFADEFH